MDWREVSIRGAAYLVLAVAWGLGSLAIVWLSGLEEKRPLEGPLPYTPGCVPACCPEALP